MLRISLAILSPFVVLVSLFAGGCAHAPTERIVTTTKFQIPKTVPLAPQHPLDVGLPGVPNFGFVTHDVWRGGEPSPEGLQTLATMGVKTVVDLRAGSDESADIPKGVVYERVPISGWQADQVDFNKVIRLIRTSPKPIFIHCREGRDRTGLAIAAYRLTQGMSAADACRELHNFHVNMWWDQTMTNRVYQLQHTIGLVSPTIQQ